MASIPPTVGAYWLSGMGSDFSLDMVVVGGLLAGYLAGGSTVDGTAAGVRAGVIGSAPGVVWILGQTVPAAFGAGGPVAFRVAAVGLAVGSGVLPPLIGAPGGFLGGKVGGWLAGKTGRRRSAPV
ncbi:hypothetical protein GCM10027355_02940 [Haloplanus salinarum]